MDGQEAFLAMAEGQESRANVPGLKAELKFSAGEY